MVLLKAISSEGGELLPAGSVLTERHIRQLLSWNLETFDVESGASTLADVVKFPEGVSPAVIDLETAGLVKAAPKFRPKGYETEGGATFIVDEPITHTAEPIGFERSVLVYGDIGPGVTIDAKEAIQVVGAVSSGVKLTAGADVTIKGTVNGSVDMPVSISGGRITLGAVSRARITARDLVTAESLVHCITRALGIVEVTGDDPGIIAGETESGVGIRAGSAGGDANAISVIRVLLSRQKQLFQASTKIERMIQEKESEVAGLEKVIEVIRLLGEKVVSLPAEKKQELAIQSRRYMDLKTEIIENRATLERIRSEVETAIQGIEECPIQIRKIRPGLEIVIGSSSLKLNSRQSATGYHLRAGRILAISH